MICYIVLSSFLLHTATSSSNSSASSPTSNVEIYDQKQTGDYNVRLHLKDFQIIAILGNDALSAMNDNYEYDYEIPEEYLDVSSVTTQKPSDTSSATTIKTTTKPMPVVTNKQPEVSTTTQTTTQKTVSTSTIDLQTTTQKAENSSGSDLQTPTQKTSISSTTEQAIEIDDEEKLSTTTFKSVMAKLDTLAIDKIPVMVMQGNFDEANVESINQKPEVSVGNVAIIPEEEVGSSLVERPVALGEILHYKRCAHGYTRDKRGRCRKIRRPQLPFDISRLASNWAARLKHSKLESASETAHH